MANEFTVFEGFRTQLVTALTGMTNALSQPIVVEIGIGWPSQPKFAELSGDPTKCLVSIYDRKVSKPVRSFLPHQFAATINPTGITATLNKANLPPADTATITLAFAVGFSAVQLNDAVGLGVHMGKDDDGATASAVAGETLTTLAAKLRDAINANPTLNDWISATALGAVVTITNLTTKPLRLGANTGNVNQGHVEVARQSRQAQVVIWTSTNDVRKRVGAKVEEFLGQLQADYGFALGNQHVRVMLEGGLLNDENVKMDIYRQDFVFSLEYGITRIDQAWSVLVAIGSYVNLDTGEKI